MEDETIDYIKLNKLLFMWVWILLALVYSYLIVIGFKYLGYTFLVETPAPFIALWLLTLILTHVLVKTGIWIYFIDKIKNRRDKKWEKKIKKK